VRLNLYWRGRDVLDVELHLWRRRDEPTAEAAPTMQANGGGQAERSDHFGDPATIVTFGFQA